MDRLRRVISNTVISLIGQLVTWTSTLLLTVAYGRFLGDLKFGELYFATTFVLLIGIPIERGFDQQITREVAQKPQEALRYLANTLLIKCVLWLVFYVILLVLCQFLGYSLEERWLVAISGLALLSTALTTTFAAMHYSFERVVFTVVGTILEKGLSALVGILLLRQGAGVVVMAFVLLGGSTANALWQGFWFFRLNGLRFPIDGTLIRGLLRTSIPFMIYGMMGVLYYRLDTVLLSLMTNDAVVGWYGAGYRLFDTMVFLPSLVITAIMYPVFSKLSISSEKTMKLAIEKTLNFLMVSVLPVASLMIFAAPNIIGYLYRRDEFDNSVPVLQALAPGIVFLYANSVFSSAIVSVKQEKKITVQAGIALAFNLGANLVLIPLFKHVGAAIVTSATEGLLFCLYVFFSLPRHLLPSKSLPVIIKAVIASAVMAVVIWFLQKFSILLILPVAGVVYLLVAAVLGTIPREDIRALYSAVRNKAHRGAAEATAPSDGGVSLVSTDIPSAFVDEADMLEYQRAITEKRLPVLKLTDWDKMAEVGDREDQKAITEKRLPALKQKDWEKLMDDTLGEEREVDTLKLSAMSVKMAAVEKTAKENVVKMNGHRVAKRKAIRVKNSVNGAVLRNKVRNRDKRL